MKATHYLFLLILAGSCAVNPSLLETKARERMQSLDQESQRNINHLISMIEEQDSLTDPGAKHSIPYEFRIPLDSNKKREIQRIDPSIQFTNRTDTYQCIGDSATKEKVFRIVSLPYTYKIKFCPYE
ncbi:MAG TPA: hypothetical protein VFU05_10205 [Cyclobacteriaceae bacterium]|nr:hypothetical protein [Cyclobacteriaceae bacterium]